MSALSDRFPIRKGAYAIARVEEAVQKYPDSVFSQMVHTVNYQDLWEFGITFSREERASKRMYEAMRIAITDMEELGIQVQDVRSISTEHVVRLCAFWWHRKKRARSTLDLYLAGMRRFMASIGRPDVIPRGWEWRQQLESVGVPF